MQLIAGPILKPLDVCKLYVAITQSVALKSCEKIEAAQVRRCAGIPGSYHMHLKRKAGVGHPEARHAGLPNSEVNSPL